VKGKTVAALRRTHEARAHFRTALVERSNVAGILVVIDYLIAICHVISPSVCAVYKGRAPKTVPVR
jgi:hypothetical protein